MAIQTLDFSPLRFDLKQISESRILSQFHKSPVLKLLLGAFTDEIQELLDAIVDLMEQRTLAKAKGPQLDAIGRIVGRNRRIFNYDEEYWFAPESEDVQPDNGHWWTHPYPKAVEQTMDDVTFRKWIGMKIIENHNKFSSHPEIVDAIKDGLGEQIGIEQTGDVAGKIITRKEISLTNYNLLDYHINTNLVDNEFLFPYQAATEITGKEKK